MDILAMVCIVSLLVAPFLVVKLAESLDKSESEN